MNIRDIVCAAAFFALAGHAGAQDTASSEPRPAQIEFGESRSLTISGFGDILADFQNKDDGSTFYIGQTEVDIESDLTEKFSIALAIAYDNEAFAIGAFTVDCNLFTANDEAAPSLLGIESVTVGGGQFDIPFGIDWHEYPSIERKIISSPLVVENTHGLWNDYGGYLAIESEFGNAVAFMANGFCYEGCDPSGESLTTENLRSGGGRIGLIPHKSIEIGASVASVEGRNNTVDMLLGGGDFRISLKELKLKGEYIAHNLHSGEIGDFTNDGYYVQAQYGIGEISLVGRYDEFRPNRENTDIQRWALGAGRTIRDRVELRFEYDINKSIDDSAIFQVAFRF